MVFSEFEKQIREKTGRTFDGDIRKLIEQVNSLGINELYRKFLDEPAKRPNAQVALKEFEAIRVKVGILPILYPLSLQ